MDKYFWSDSPYYWPELDEQNDYYDTEVKVDGDRVKIVTYR